MGNSELEGLIEALNEAAINPFVCPKLAADPVAALRSIGVAIPEGVTIEVGRRPDGAVRLTVKRCWLSEDELEQVVGGSIPAITCSVVAVIELPSLVA